MPQYWLFKSEPDVYGLDHLKRDGTTPWSGVRNWQARKNMAAMHLGDLGFFYHSSTKVPGVAGICKVVREFYPDHTQFDPASEYYDRTSRPERPKWSMVEVEYVEELAHLVSLARIKADERLRDMVLVRDSRLSVQPVTAGQWKIVLALAKHAG